jgi:hypothetical protein
MHFVAHRVQKVSRRSEKMEFVSTGRGCFRTTHFEREGTSTVFIIKCEFNLGLV